MRNNELRASNQLVNERVTPKKMMDKKDGQILKQKHNRVDMNKT